MRKFLIILLSLLSCLLCACSYKQEPVLEAWQVPEIETAPVAPTPTPFVPSGGKTLNIIWNEADSINMSDPGVQGNPEEKQLSFSKSLALFPWDFLPYELFGSKEGYPLLRVEQIPHGVLLDENGQLLENAYVQFRFLPKDGNEAQGVTVMAELVSRERQIAMYDSTLAYPHLRYDEGVQPLPSRYGLDSFLLSRCGQYRYAQMILPLPNNVSSDRVILLTMGCGLELSDEQLVDALMEIWEYQS